MRKDWWKESVVYQIYPRSFMDSNGDGIGDLCGIIEKLPYLEELGIDVIWLSPVYDSPNDDNGYDIRDYQKIMEEFGTMEDFDRLIETAHKHNIKILMDLVVNHTSDEHRWFVESKKGKDNPYYDYYIWKDGKDGNPPNNWGSVFSGSAWQYSEENGQYYLHLFSKKQPDLNWENEKVRKEVYDMMTWWLEKGVDGFRMDVISMISKDQSFPDGEKGEGKLYGDFGKYSVNGPRVHEFLKEMRNEVLDKFDTMTVGETAGVTIEEAMHYASEDGSELNMVFQFEHTDLDADSISKWNRKKMPIVEMKKTLSKWQVELEGKAWNSLYWCNHDQPRVVSRLGDDKEYRELSAKMIATSIHMMKGTPYIYQGEELGMTNVNFPSIDEIRDIESINAYHEMSENGIYTKEEMLDFIRYKGRDNARTPMQWDSSSYAGFSTSEPWIMVNPNYTEINAKEQMSRENSVFHYYKKLIQLRKEHKIIVYGTYELLLPEHEQLFVYKRKLGGQELLCVCNFSKEQLTYELPQEFVGSEILIHNYDAVEVQNGKMSVRPYETVVFYSK